MKKWIIPLAGIAGITALDLVALQCGFDGQLTMLACAAIGAIATGGTVKVWSSKGWHFQLGKERKSDNRAK